jgi:aminopeptidase N
MGSHTVKRVEDVTLLRTLQFAEDAGPMAHPIRPESYIEISNFYTMTIYEKGAEIIRMLATLLGKDDFRKGTDLYFDRHDGQAVTTEDFVAALADASGRDLTQFKRWYAQAGTPRLQVTDYYDEDTQEYSLTIKQSCPPTPECQQKLPFHIPVAVGLLGSAGDLPLYLKDVEPDFETGDNTHNVLELTSAEQTFVFQRVQEKPVPSLLRGFSAPVKLHYNYSRDDLIVIMSRDSDGFNRWEASQQLGLQAIHHAMGVYQRGEDLATVQLDTELIGAYRSVLQDDSLDKAMVAYMLSLPSEAYLSELADVVDVEAIHYSRAAIRKIIARELRDDFMRIYHADTPLAQQLTEVALADFYQRWQHESLVVNQWISVQATCVLPNTLAKVKALQAHAAYDSKNPNKIRALVASFCNGNPINFHVGAGAGYQFLADQIIVLNAQNPQIASRLLTPAEPNLSKDVFEVVSKSLV